jgi:peptidoglycan/LPS O-acetylase OafA/YrhL
MTACHLQHFDQTSPITSLTLPTSSERIASSERIVPSTPSSEIRAMTGLRGIAALMVVVYHFYPGDALPAGGLRLFVTKGYLWVDLFFILSGFLMAMTYGKLFAGRWSLRTWLSFLWKRLARVYPLYIVIVAATLAYTLGSYGSPKDPSGLSSIGLNRPLVDVVANVLLMQSWGISRSVDGVAWSLSTEWGAYLLFPLLAWLALFERRGTAVAVALAVAAIVVGTVGLTMQDGAYHSGPLDAYDGTTVQPMLRCFGGFVLGLLTFRVSQSPRLLAWVSHDVIAALAVMLLVAGFATGAHDLVVYPLFAVIVLALYGNRGWIARIFGCRPVHWLGLVSYSLYLLHIYFLGPRDSLDQWFQARLPDGTAGFAADAVICVTLLTLSGLAYRGIEEPGRRWMRCLNQVGVRFFPGAAGKAESAA